MTHRARQDFRWHAAGANGWVDWRERMHRTNVRFDSIRLRGGAYADELRGLHHPALLVASAAILQAAQP